MKKKVYLDRMSFSNDVMIDKLRKMWSVPPLYFQTIEKHGTFEICNYISECVKLVQFMDNLGNINSAVIFDGVWIYHSYEKSTSFGKILVGYHMFAIRWWWNCCRFWFGLLCSELC